MPTALSDIDSPTVIPQACGWQRMRDRQLSVSERPTGAGLRSALRSDRPHRCPASTGAPGGVLRIGGRGRFQAARDAIEREHVELVFQASRDERRVYQEAMKVIPQSAVLYRAAVRDLNSTLKEPTERAEARALIAELLGQQVRIRQDGAAVFARLEIDEVVLVASAEKSL
jgi:hypothetical protein